MNQVIMKIIGNKKIADRTYLMELEGDTSAITKPGQFVNIKLDGFFSAARSRFATARTASFR